jgi:DNA invertase Pin-like site-specific DNA recombinase
MADCGSRTRPLRAAIYCRVSTARDQNPRMQLDELRQVARQRGWDVIGEFVDVGISGAKDRRPELDHLMQLTHRGAVDIVAVWKFDRFARSTRQLVTALDDFRARGIDFFSARDSIDTTSPAGRFSFSVIAAVAELERELIRERTIAGIEAARRCGRHPGRPPVVFDLDRARELRANGASIRMIAKTLGVAAATVHRGLRTVSKRSACGTLRASVENAAKSVTRTRAFRGGFRHAADRRRRNAVALTDSDSRGISGV